MFKSLALAFLFLLAGALARAQVAAPECAAQQKQIEALNAQAAVCAKRGQVLNAYLAGKTGELELTQGVAGDLQKQVQELTAANAELRAALAATRSPR